MNINDFAIPVILAVVGTILTMIVSIFNSRLARRREAEKEKQEAEKEKERQRKEQYNKWLGPSGIPPKDEHEAVLIARSEGRNVQLPSPSSSNLIRLIIIFFIVGSVSYLLNSQAALIGTSTETPIPGITTDQTFTAMPVTQTTATQIVAPGSPTVFPPASVSPTQTIPAPRTPTLFLLTETFTQTIVAPGSPTPVPPTLMPTTEIPPTFPATLPTHQLTYLSSQADVFSPNCFLLDHDRVYDHFANNQASITTTLADGRTGQGLRLDYFNVHDVDWSYAGWEVWFGVNDQSGIDLSSYSLLVFYIRGSVGGEQPNIYLMMPITTDYRRYWKDVERVTPVTTSWRRVEIPLSHFASSQEPHQQVDLRNVQRIQILFEWYPQPTSGTIFIDDLCVQ